MTTQTKNQLRLLFWTVLGGLILLGAPKLAGQIILRPEFDTHVMSDTSWKREQRELTMEVVCELKPQRRGCR